MAQTRFPKARNSTPYQGGGFRRPVSQNPKPGIFCGLGFRVYSLPSSRYRDNGNQNGNKLLFRV